MDIDETSVEAKFQSQISKVARFCARKTAEGRDVGEAEMDALRDRFKHTGADLGSQPGQVDVDKDLEVAGEDGINTSSTGLPESGSG